MSILKIISLGNDIVDLSDPDTVRLTENPKFLQKVYSQTELEALIHTPAHLQHRYLWKLWAAKEASYKAVKRLRQDIVFSPKKFEFHAEQSRVLYQGNPCSITLIENNDYIYACSVIYEEATKDPFKQDSEVQNWIAKFSEAEKSLDESTIEIIPSYSRESTLCRNFAALKIGSYMQNTQVRLEKDASSRSSIPEIWVNNAKTNHLISTSHHGRYCAVMLCMKE